MIRAPFAWMFGRECVYSDDALEAIAACLVDDGLPQFDCRAESTCNLRAERRQDCHRRASEWRRAA